MFHVCVLSQELTKTATEICQQATTGRFLDADQKPTTVLIEMTRVGVA